MAKKEIPFAKLAELVYQIMSIRYDVRLGAIVGSTGARWRDADTSLLRAQLSAQKIEVGKVKLADAIEFCAHTREFDPVVEYLTALPPWDGIARSGFSKYFGAAPGAWADACWGVLSRSAIARAMQPGCKVDTLTVLEGDQGRFKSTGLRALTGDAHFSDTMFPLDEAKRIIESLSGVWIAEVAELSGLRGRDAEKIKASLSSAVDHARLSYGRFAEEVPRRSIFVATRNPDGAPFLTDLTGARRYLPIAVGAVDVEGIRRDRDQLWAEALHRYRAGEKWWLVGEEVELHTTETEARSEADPWIELVATWLAKGRPAPPPTAPQSLVPFPSPASPEQTKTPYAEVTLDDLFERGGPVPIDIDRRDQRAANRMARVLRKLGWTRHRVRRCPCHPPGETCPEKRKEGENCPKKRKVWVYQPDFRLAEGGPSLAEGGPSLAEGGPSMPDTIQQKIPAGPSGPSVPGVFVESISPPPGNSKVVENTRNTGSTGSTSEKHAVSSAPSMPRATGTTGDTGTAPAALGGRPRTPQRTANQ